MTAHILASILFLAGDSTLDDQGFTYPYRSWGREAEPYMEAGCSVANFARSGHSSRSFDEAGYWAKLVADVKPGDFVVIQFGHNDQKRSTPFYLEKRWAAPDGLYRDTLRRWIGEVRAKGATPVLVSPICRATFDHGGTRLVDTTHASSGVCLRSYRDAMASLAAEVRCDFVDMNTLTHDFLERLGRDGAEKLFAVSAGVVKSKDGEPSHDVTHPCKAGAEAFAKLFVDDARARGLPIASLFRDAGHPAAARGQPAPLRMQNIAHRGMWDRYVPQNTVEAIARAYASGATWVETDFHYTKAGQMVCMHAERELASQTGCGKKVADLTPEDVKTLDLGKVAGLDRPYRIPLLGDILALVPSNGVVQAEIKGYSPQYADIFDAAVRAAGLTERNVVVSSFQYDALKDFKSRYPRYRAVWLAPLPEDGPFDVEQWIRKCKDGGFEVFCPGCRATEGKMTRKDADAVRAAGLEFRLFGVNSPEDLERAKELGATGFTCNFWREAFSWADAAGGVELLK